MTRVLVAGAGALGTLYGAVFARGGADVQLLARRPHAEAIQRSGGVTVTSQDRQWWAPLSAVWQPERVAPADILVVLTKSHDTEAALAGLDHIRDGLRVAVSLQNGVEKDALLARWCGADRVLGGVSMVGATLERPGTVSHTLLGTTYIGELAAGGDCQQPRALARLLEIGGLPVVVSAHIGSIEWSKLVHSAPAMTVTALSRLSFHAALQDRGLSVLYVDLVREGAAVAVAAGVELGDWPGMFPVHTIAVAPRQKAVQLARERGQQMAQIHSTAVRISMLRDIEQGRRLELDAVHGFLVAEADRFGVSAPLSRSSYLLLRALDTSGAQNRNDHGM